MRRSLAPSRRGFQTPFKKNVAPVVEPPKQPEEKEDEKESEATPKLTVVSNPVRRVGLSRGRPSLLNASPKPTPAKFTSPLTSPAKETAESPIETSNQPARYYKVLWCKWSKKKHKTYNDGVLVIKDRACILKDMQAKEIGKTTSYSLKDLSELKEGNTLSFSGKEVEIQDEITASNYESGSVFLEEVETVKATQKLKPQRSLKTKFKAHSMPAGSGAEKSPMETAGPIVKKPRHTIEEDSFVLWNPGEPNEHTVAVVMDPHINSILQPHQREGIQFMYDCVMGNKGAGTGCILADEMGLGKTLQAIALIWTLLKQSPTGVPATKKVIVVTPSSLTRNWENEVLKWLGSERLKPLAVGHASLNKEEVKQRIRDFKHSNIYPLLIISYDQFRINIDEIQTIKTCNLVICDEGHKLKNSNAKITKAINSLETRRRIIITGTPIQNDLDEFFAMVNLCNPGFMDYKKFRDVFARPILEGRDSNATEEQKRESSKRSAELLKRTERFIIRRTKDLLKNYLPPRVEQIVFCKLAPLQVDLYKFFLRSATVYSVLNLCQTAVALSAIISLRKLCNHPALVYPKAVREDSEEGFSKALNLFPEDFSANKYRTDDGGKLVTLAALLREIRKTTRDRVVIVSNFTQSLNVLEVLCGAANYPFLRLDGKTSKAIRQNLVDRFNDRTSDYFVFLLSSKAGNVGFNLVGANRIVLFDPDWNPANDQQAMGRVWRYGQKRKVWIYRLVSTGTIEEKIFQRQMAKEGLSNSVVDGNRMTKESTKARFTKEELRDIFSYNEVTLCDTHELFGCNCLEADEEETVPKKKKRNNLQNDDIEQSKKQMAMWKHCRFPESMTDPALRAVASAEDTTITFVFEKETQKDLPDVDVISNSQEEAGDKNPKEEEEEEEEEKGKEKEEDEEEEGNTEEEEEEEEGRADVAEEGESKDVAEEAMQEDEEEQASPQEKKRKRLRKGKANQNKRVKKEEKEEGNAEEEEAGEEQDEAEADLFDSED